MAAELRSQSGLRAAVAELAGQSAGGVAVLGAGRPQSVSSAELLRQFQFAARAREGRRGSEEPSAVAVVAVAEVVQVEVVGVVVARARARSEPWSMGNQLFWD